MYLARPTRAWGIADHRHPPHRVREVHRCLTATALSTMALYLSAWQLPAQVRVSPSSLAAIPTAGIQGPAPLPVPHHPPQHPNCSSHPELFSAPPRPAMTVGGKRRHDLRRCAQQARNPPRPVRLPGRRGTRPSARPGCATGIDTGEVIARSSGAPGASTCDQHSTAASPAPRCPAPEPPAERSASRLGAGAPALQWVQLLTMSAGQSRYAQIDSPAPLAACDVASMNTTVTTVSSILTVTD